MPFGTGLAHCKRGHKFSDENTVIRNRNGSIRRECRTCRSESAKTWRVGKQDKRSPKYIWQRNLKTYYNITPAQWQIMFDLQLGVCAICEEPEENNRLAVDHDHSCCSGNKSCGKCIRALLCTNCNNGLGRFKDSLERLNSAISYLERY